MEKATIFIDYGYLSKILKYQFKEVRVDYVKLCDEICKKLNLLRFRTYFYYCKPLIRRGSEVEDQKKLAGFEKFIQKIKRLPRFEVKLGTLQLIGGEFKQKKVDILMSLDIVDMAFGKIDRAIIITGDSDFVPSIKQAKNYGTLTHLFYHPSAVHNELLDYTDELHIIDDDLVNKSKLQ